MRSFFLLPFLFLGSCVPITQGAVFEDRVRMVREIGCARLSRCNDTDFEQCIADGIFMSAPPTTELPFDIDVCLRAVAETSCEEPIAYACASLWSE